MDDVGVPLFQETFICAQCGQVKFELDAVNRPFFKPGFPNPLKEVLGAGPMESTCLAYEFQCCFAFG